MSTTLRHTVSDNSIVREGHRPHKRTIADALNAVAMDRYEFAFVRDDLEMIRLGKEHRNAPVGACENCGAHGTLHVTEIEGVEFLVCATC